jgi:superfamily II DNA helicase RecQ
MVPKTLNDFAELSGVGERKLLKYGEQFLAAIRQAERAHLE